MALSRELPAQDTTRVQQERSRDTEEPTATCGTARNLRQVILIGSSVSRDLSCCTRVACRVVERPYKYYVPV